jgi:hypothetical protein
MKPRLGKRTDDVLRLLRNADQPMPWLALFFVTMTRTAFALTIVMKWETREEMNTFSSNRICSAPQVQQPSTRRTFFLGTSRRRPLPRRRDMPPE